MAHQAPLCPTSVDLYMVTIHQTLDYTITLEGPTNSGLTWIYKAKKNTGNDLSHFDVQICSTAVITSWKIFKLAANGTCSQLLAEGTEPNHYFKVQNGDSTIPCMGSTRLIKFDNLGDFDVTDFCFEFTLAECYSIGCPLIGGKAGTAVDCENIQGPSPDCVPCLTRGLDFKIY